MDHEIYDIYTETEVIVIILSIMICTFLSILGCVLLMIKYCSSTISMSLEELHEVVHVRHSITSLDSGYFEI